MKKGLKTSIAIFVVLIMIGIAFEVFAAEKEENGKNEKKREKIEAVIHGTGVIDRVSSSEVVLGDQLFQIAPNASKKLAEDGSYYSGSLKKGMLIGIELNKEREIVTIWVLKQNK